MAKQGLDAAPIVLDHERGWIEHLPERLQPMRCWRAGTGRSVPGCCRWPCWWALALAPAARTGGWCPCSGSAPGDARRRLCGQRPDGSRARRPSRAPWRRLASGRLGVPQALAFLALQLLVGALVLLAFNGFAVALALASLPLIVIYP